MSIIAYQHTDKSTHGFCLALSADKPKHVYQYFGLEKKK